MSEKSDKVKWAILKALSESGKPLGAEQVKTAILSMGVDLQARMIRHHMMNFDEQGLTTLVSRRLGREITESGRDELARLDIPEMAEIIASRVDALGYRMTFDSDPGKGTVIINVSFINPYDIGIAAKEIQLVVDRGLAFGDKVIVAKAGEKIGDVVVPEGMLGIGTVCSISLNGILQKKGIPVTPRFGGLLEVHNRQYVRFLNMIEYRGSSLDPLEVFIRADMSRVRDVVLRGSGVICASFREIPAVALSDLQKIARNIRKYGLGGILVIGKPSQPLMGVPVTPGYCGLIVAGGLNSIAAVHEAGIRIVSHSLAGLEDYARLMPVRNAASEY